MFNEWLKLRRSAVKNGEVTYESSISHCSDCVLLHPFGVLDGWLIDDLWLAPQATKRRCFAANRSKQPISSFLYRQADALPLTVYYFRFFFRTSGLAFAFAFISALPAGERGVRGSFSSTLSRRLLKLMNFVISTGNGELNFIGSPVMG
jgi:hypothetical protein